MYAFSTAGTGAFQRKCFQLPYKRPFVDVGMRARHDGLLANRSQRFVGCRVLTESAKLDVGSKAPSFTVGAASKLVRSSTQLHAPAPQ